MSITYREKLDAVRGWIYGRKTWLDGFGGPKSKFPQTLIEQKRRDLEIMQAIAADYERAVQKEAA